MYTVEALVDSSTLNMGFKVFLTLPFIGSAALSDQFNVLSQILPEVQPAPVTSPPSLTSYAFAVSYTSPYSCIYDTPSQGSTLE